MNKSNRYALSAVVLAISAWIFLIALLWPYIAVASIVLAVASSIIAILKKQNNILAITGGTVALVLFIGMIFPFVMSVAAGPDLEMYLSSLLSIIFAILLCLPGALIYQRYVKFFAKFDISYTYSCLILLTGLIGAAVLIVIFGLIAMAIRTNYDPFFFYFIAFIFSANGIQAFIYYYMTKSPDGTNIKRLHAFILSIIFIIPNFIVAVFALEIFSALTEAF